MLLIAIKVSEQQFQIFDNILGIANPIIMGLKIPKDSTFHDHDSTEDDELELRDAPQLRCSMHSQSPGHCCSRFSSHN